MPRPRRPPSNNETLDHLLSVAVDDGYEDGGPARDSQASDSQALHLAVAAVLPDVEDVVRHGDVALAVEGDVAEHRLPRALRLQRGRDLALVEVLDLAGGLQRLLGLVGEAFAVGGVVVEDRHLFAAELARDVGAGDLALLVVTAAGAEGVPAALVGEARVGGGGAGLEQ